MVEVGYSIVPNYQRLGFASEAVEFSHPEVRLVTAETLPTLIASIRVLEKNGFYLLSGGSEESVVRYGRKRV